MLTVIAGEDTAASRQNLQKRKDTYTSKGYSVENVEVNSVPDLLKNSVGVTNLFGQEAIYVVDNLSKKYKGRKKTSFKEAVQKIAKSKEIHLLDWEEGKSAYELSGLKRISSSFDEYKPEKNIFELLDSCYPGNLSGFIRTLGIVDESQEITFIYALLWKHIRKLVLAKKDALDAKIPGWQKQKLYYQAEKWNEKKLIKFYEGLARIDVAIKTSASTYDLKDSIELLVCYYLK